MTTLEELVAAEPAADRGIPTQIAHGTGTWRFVLELADPAAGASVEWYDVTDLGADRSACGYSLTRGAEEYDGPYRASVAHLDLIADDDRYAPWNPDTSATFGTHVKLGAGLLMRAGLIRVTGGDTVAEWNPRWCGKVERWMDASHARGRLRWHRIAVRDLLSSLVAQPVAATVEENWSERLSVVLAGWPYGVEVYGATFIGGSDVLTLPARAVQSSALAELKATLDPAGLIYYTDRRGVLIVRPRHDDTFHADAFDPGGASGTPWTDRPTVEFNHLALDDPGVLGLAAYATDSQVADPFGFADTEDAVRNHVKVNVAGSTVYDDDNPTSIARHERRTLEVSWLAQNDAVAATMLGYRANATVEAVPLHATVDMHGFHPGPASVDFYDTVVVTHQTAPGRSVVVAGGQLRGYTETVAPRPGGVSWSLTATVDIANVDVSDQLNPPEDLTLTDVGDTSAAFSWTNPAQTITPTEVQVRMLGHTDLWASFVYPITTRTWHSLDPETGYTFQVRLVRRVDGIITHFSAAASLAFETLAADQPIIDIDDDGDGTATLPDPDPGCDLEWKLESSPDGTTWTLVDTDTITSPPYTVDLSGYTFDATLLYKVCVRELCPAAGTWVCSNLFAGACSDPPALTVAPYDDADLVAYWPAICPPDDIVEAISEEHATHGPQFDTFTTDGDGNIVLVADGEGVIAYGVGPAAANVVTGDATIACKVIVSSQPSAAVALFGVAGLTIEALAEGANWTVRGRAYESGSGVTTITPGSLELDFGTWYDIALVHDVAAGDLFLYVDGTEVASALGTVGARHNSGIFEIGQSDNGIITNCALWDRVIAAEDLPGAAAFSPITGIGWHSAYWADGPEMLALGYTNGADVTTWPDEVGTENMASAGTATQVPTMVITDANFGNHRTLNFDATSEDQKLGYPDSSATAQAQPFTIVAIGKFDDLTSGSGTGRTMFDGGGSSNLARLRARTPSGSARWCITAGTEITSAGNANTSPHVFKALFNGASSHLEVDGSSVVSGNAGAQQWDGLMVGYARGVATANFRFDGQIAFIGVYFGDAEADAGWTDFKAWCLSYYGITVA